MKEALFYIKVNANKMKCTLCPHGCVIGEGKRGACLARENIDGALYAISYGSITALALDPIEKKPLHYFCPGSNILSLGSFGCNLKCPFCQNHSISMGEPQSRVMGIDEIANLSLELKEKGNIGVAFTYNEPIISYEFVLDCAKAIKAQRQKTALVTNGFINEEPLMELLPYIDAMNIDLKGFTDGYYKSLGGRLAPVKETIAFAKDSCHVELTTLVVPGMNDSESDFKLQCEWIASIDSDMPLHITRFFPNYKMGDKEPTNIVKMKALEAIAKRYLKCVRLGNC